MFYAKISKIYLVNQKYKVKLQCFLTNPEEDTNKIFRYQQISLFYRKGGFITP